MIQHERSVIESFPTELAGKPRSAVFLPDVLLHGAGLHLLGAVRAGQLLGVAVHPLPVIVEAARELERDPTLLTVGGLAGVALLPPLRDSNIICTKFLIHRGKVGKLVKWFSMFFHNMDK